mmetsp:Transcript_29136/g.28196  ORF Transcript_29136/g.28196 Transcript_29136/m.28196 type:complete len:163 (-) Transcript_29136:195-683(-)
MADPTGGSSTSISQIAVEWTELTLTADTGNSAITSYQLQWDAGSLGVSWYEVVGFSSDYTSTSYVINTGITAGDPYQFKIRAKNIYGEGDYSNIVTLDAVGVPDKMSILTTANDGTDIKISWSAPYDNEDAISAYKIFVLASDGSYQEDATNCDGSDLTIKG